MDGTTDKRTVQDERSMAAEAKEVYRDGRKVHPFDLEEPLLLPEPGRSRFVMHPVRHLDLYEMAEKAETIFWFSGEIDLESDVHEIDEMDPMLRHMVLTVLAFFAASDGIVNENLGDRFAKEVTWPEARYFYGIQTGIETIHSKVYSSLITAYVPDHEEQDRLFNAISTYHSVKTKAEWALRYANSSSFFGERMFAMMVVEGLFFSASFAIIFYLKTLGVLPGLTFSNELISRDEALHTEFAVIMLNCHVKHKPSVELAHSIIKEAVDIECTFVDECMPKDMMGMNPDMMKSYVRYTANRLLKRTEYPCLFGEREGEIDEPCRQPFQFMENIATETKTNFFERKVAEYQQKVSIVGRPGWTRGRKNAKDALHNKDQFSLNAYF